MSNGNNGDPKKKLIRDLLKNSGAKRYDEEAVNKIYDQYEGDVDRVMRYVFEKTNAKYNQEKINKIKNHYGLSDPVDPPKKKKNVQQRAKDLSNKFYHLPWVNRGLRGDGPFIETGFGTKRSHNLSYREDDGKYWVYPNIIQQDNGALKKFPSDEEAFRYARENELAIPTNDRELAKYYAENFVKEDSKTVPDKPIQGQIPEDVNNFVNELNELEKEINYFDEVNKNLDTNVGGKYSGYSNITKGAKTSKEELKAQRENLITKFNDFKPVPYSSVVNTMGKGEDDVDEVSTKSRAFLDKYLSAMQESIRNDLNMISDPQLKKFLEDLSYIGISDEDTKFSFTDQTNEDGRPVGARIAYETREGRVLSVPVSPQDQGPVSDFVRKQLAYEEQQDINKSTIHSRKDFIRKLNNRVRETKDKGGDVGQVVINTFEEEGISTPFLEKLKEKRELGFDEAQQDVLRTSIYNTGKRVEKSGTSALRGIREAVDLIGGEQDTKFDSTYLKDWEEYQNEELDEEVKKLLYGTTSTKYEGGVKDRYVELGGVKVLVDADHNPMGVRRKDGTLAINPTVQEKKAVQEYAQNRDLYEDDVETDYRFPSIMRQSVQVMSDMVPIIAASAASAGVGLPASAGVFGGSFSITYGDYYEEQFNKTGDAGNASLYATTASTLTAALENMAGVEASMARRLGSKGVKKVIDRTAAEVAAKKIIKGEKIWQVFAKNVVKENAGELLTEVSQTIGDRVVDFQFNKDPINSAKFMDEMEAVAILTPLASTPMSMMTNAGADLNAQIMENFEIAARSKDKFNALVDQWVESSETEEQREQRQKDADQKKAIVDELSDVISATEELNLEEESSNEAIKIARKIARLRAKNIDSDSKHTRSKNTDRIAKLEEDLTEVISKAKTKKEKKFKKRDGVEKDEIPEVSPGKNVTISQDGKKTAGRVKVKGGEKIVVDEKGNEYTVDDLKNNEATIIDEDGNKVSFQPDETVVEDSDTKVEESEEPETQEVTDDVFNQFMETGEVSQPVLLGIANKMANNEELNEREQSIREDKSEEVEELLKDRKEETSTDKESRTLTLDEREMIGEEYGVEIEENAQPKGGDMSYTIISSETGQIVEGDLEKQVRARIGEVLETPQPEIQEFESEEAAQEAGENTTNPDEENTHNVSKTRGQTREYTFNNKEYVNNRGTNAIVRNEDGSISSVVLKNKETGRIAVLAGESALQAAEKIMEDEIKEQQKEQEFEEEVERRAEEGDIPQPEPETESDSDGRVSEETERVTPSKSKSLKNIIPKKGEQKTSKKNPYVKKVKKQIEKIKKALSGFVPNLEVQTFETAEEFSKYMLGYGQEYPIDPETGRVGKSGAFISTPEGKKIIAINLQEVQDNTVYHEGSHALLDLIFKINPDLTNTFYEELKSLVEENIDIQKYIDYGNLDPTYRKEEAIVEFLADFMEGKIPPDSIGIDLEQSVDLLTKIKNIISKVISKFTGEDYEVKDLDLKSLASYLRQSIEGNTTLSNKAINPDIIKSLGEVGELSVKTQIVGEHGVDMFSIATRSSVLKNKLAEAKKIEKKLGLKPKDWTKTSKEGSVEKIKKRKVLRSTGWQRGADGKWKYDTPDVKINLKRLFNRLIRGGTIALSDVVDNDVDLFNMYPDVASLPITVAEDFGKGAARLNKTGDRDVIEFSKSWVNTYVKARFLSLFGMPTMEKFGGDVQEVIIHEVQHMIQDIEDFEVGTSPEYVATSPLFLKEILAPSLLEVYAHYALFEQGGKTAANSLFYKSFVEGLDQRQKTFLRNLRKGNFKKSRKEILDQYYRTMGEVEAYNTSARKNLSKAERGKILLEDSEGVPREHQIPLFAIAGIVDSVMQDAYGAFRDYLKNVYGTIRINEIVERLLTPTDQKQTGDNNIQERIESVQEEINIIREELNQTGTYSEYMIELNEKLNDKIQLRDNLIENFTSQEGKALLDSNSFC